MIRINILSGSQRDPFFAHRDKERFPESEYYIAENSNEDIVWDAVVVYEKIKSPLTVKCKDGNLFYFAGEPPLMRPLLDSFLQQFDKVIIPNKKSKHPHKILSHGFLNWSLGVSFLTKKNKYSYRDFKNLDVSKSKNISIVTSTKKMMPGHNRRMYIIKKMKEDFPGQIDYFGMGSRAVDYKIDALLPYRFHICMENSTIPYYWTEKFADPIIAKSIPIYMGCTNVSDYFDTRGFFQCNYNDYKQLHDILTTVLKDPKGVYQQMLPYLEKNKQILMEEQNIIPYVIEKLYVPSNASATRTIMNQENFKFYKLSFLKIRIIRFAFKIIFSLTHSKKNR